MQLFSLVVPMYNEKSSVDEFFSTVEPVLEEASRQYSLEYEIVVVDDGSSDGTEAALEAHVVRNPRIRAVILSRNFGKEYAVSAGLAAARGDAVVPIDADLQDPIELIFSMLERWKQGAEVVVAVQKNRDAESFAKKRQHICFTRYSMPCAVPNCLKMCAIFVSWTDVSWMLCCNCLNLIAF